MWQKNVQIVAHDAFEVSQWWWLNQLDLFSVTLNWSISSLINSLKKWYKDSLSWSHCPDLLGMVGVAYGKLESHK